MIKRNIFKTNNLNHYLFDNKKKFIFYIPPDMVNELEGNKPVNSNLKSDSYYKEKIAFLKEHQISTKKLNNNFKIRYNEDYIEEKLKQLDLVCFEVTQKCNLRCKYCTYGEIYQNNEERFIKTLKLSTAITLIDYLFEQWDKVRDNKIIEKTFSFYGGEPLLKMDIIKEIVSYIKKKYSNHYIFKFNITTNGVLLKEYINYLVSEDFNVLFSLDGDRKGNIYRVSVNGESIYDKLIHNLLFVKKTHPEYFKQKINFNAILNSNNSISDLNKFFEEKFPENDFTITNLTSTGIKSNKIVEFNKINYDSKKEKADRESCFQIERKLDTGLFKHYSDLKRNAFSFNFSSPVEMTVKENSCFCIPTGTCSPFDKLFLNTSGEILPCEKVHDKYVLGRVLKTGVNLDFKTIADLYEQNFNKIIKKCSECWYQDICKSCVFSMDSKNEFFHCPNYMSRQKYLNNIKSLIQDVELLGENNVLR